MQAKFLKYSFFFLLWMQFSVSAQDKESSLPTVYADVPDASIIRVGKNYYMSSTTMHMSPHVPIMKSTDLVNWKLLNYACDTLASIPELNLTDGKNTYGRGSWASSLRYHRGMFYVTTFAGTTNETYIFKTKNIEKGNWQRVQFKPAYHDHSLFFDDDGTTYLIYGGGTIKMLELNSELTGIKAGTTEKILIENASAPAGNSIMLGAEGSQVFKRNGIYYLFNICWPNNGMRTVIVHRANNINGPWEGKIGFQDMGIAQGGLIDTPDGRWFSYLFRDFGAVGRTPYLIPVKWENDWPILGDNGKMPSTISLPKSKGLLPSLVASDAFDRKKGQNTLPLVWQWNHNPENSLWSLKERKGFLRLKTDRLDIDITQARNTLTQRTIGPQSTASTLLDASNLKEGDFAGLCALQKKYGFVGITIINGQKTIICHQKDDKNETKIHAIAMNNNQVYLKIICDFTNKKDEARFFYSLDNVAWLPIGEVLKMEYTLPHFMGYRFGLFNYATKNVGGYADFDYFHIDDTISN